MIQFEDIGLHGTKVLIYNLWMNDDGLLELDFEDDEEVLNIFADVSTINESCKVYYLLSYKSYSCIKQDAIYFTIFYL